ncbi:MAG: helix-turn-helix domain-containing protein [Clostridia bacterium]|nr:helix-turn-helix domain-containing protein [Clostridia bacterium]MBP3706128.1 helix-turn-helix domain-containing protein [Clostridia bacterium]
MQLGTIGKKIAKYRLLKKFTQEDLAERTNLSSNYIGMIERGEKTPSLETFISILNALEIASDPILDDVLKVGYITKTSILTEKLSKISEEDRRKIYEVVEVLVKNSKRIKP